MDKSEQEWEIYGHSEFRNICRISIAHLYNLRGSHFYLSITKRYTRTKPAAVKIGERARPTPGGSPGYIRVDSVHQGDNQEEKGVYNINAVDEVTQWEIVASVEKIAVLSENNINFPDRKSLSQNILVASRNDGLKGT